MYAIPIHIISGDSAVPVTAAPVITYVESSPVSITINIGSVSGASSYKVKYRTSPSGSFTTINNVSSGNYTITGLDSETSYNIKATAVNSESVESADSNIVTNSTLAALEALFISQTSSSTFTNACNYTGDTDPVFHDGDTTTPQIGDTIYLDSAGTIPFNGGGNWWTSVIYAFQINSSGEIINDHICPF